METKVNVKPVIMYQASIRFEGKFYTTPMSESVDETLEYVKRARLKTNSKYLQCNIMCITRYVLAE